MICSIPLVNIFHTITFYCIYTNGIYYHFMNNKNQYFFFLCNQIIYHFSKILSIYIFFNNIILDNSNLTYCFHHSCFFNILFHDIFPKFLLSLFQHLLCMSYQTIDHLFVRLLHLSFAFSKVLQ